VVGDVCLSRRANGGRHTVVPLHAAIQERCRALGFETSLPLSGTRSPMPATEPPAAALDSSANPTNRMPC
jgi:hypothetical protein